MFPTWEGQVTNSGYKKPAPLPSIGGGPTGRAATILGTEIGKRDPPVRRYLDAFRHTGMTLGTVYTMSRPTTTRPLGKKLQGKIS